MACLDANISFSTSRLPPGDVVAVMRMLHDQACAFRAMLQDQAPVLSDEAPPAVVAAVYEEIDTADAREAARRAEVEEQIKSDFLVAQRLGHEP